MSSEGLERFVKAQERVYAQALAELRRGQKQGHWMWFIFPQMRGLGVSSISWHYGIASRAEAAEYLAHPELGPRIRECIETVNRIQGRSAVQIFGSVDAMKLRSSATLFDAVGGGPQFRLCLDCYFDGRPDSRTLELLAAGG